MKYLPFAFVLLVAGCGHGSMFHSDGPGDGIGYVDLITEPHAICKTYSNSDLQRLTNRHPTRRVIVKRMTETDSNPDGQRVTIMNIVLEPAEAKKPFVGCVRHDDGREANRIIEEAWLYTTPELK